MQFTTPNTTSFSVNEAAAEIGRTIRQIADMRSRHNHHISSEPIIYLAGQPGIGKTFIVNQAAHDNGFAVYTLIGASLLSEDVGGQPVVVGNDGVTPSVRFSPSMIVQEVHATRTKTGKPVVLFLDEASRIQPDVQAPLLSFLQFRGIHGAYLPSDTIIIMAGNREDDDGGGVPLLAPMINRVHIMDVHADPKEWVRWALSAPADKFPTPLHPLVAATVVNFPGQTGPFNFDPANGSAPFGSPRSWEAVNEYVVYQEKMGAPVDIRRVAAIVGKQNASVLAAQAKFMSDLVPSADILADPLGAKVHTEPAAACMQLMMLPKACKSVEDINAAIRYATRPDPNNPSTTVPKWAMFLGMFGEGIVRAVAGEPDRSSKGKFVGGIKDPRVHDQTVCEYIPFLMKYGIGGAGLMRKSKKLL